MLCARNNRPARNTVCSTATRIMATGSLGGEDTALYLVELSMHSRTRWLRRCFAVAGALLAASRLAPACFFPNDCDRTNASNTLAVGGDPVWPS